MGNPRIVVFGGGSTGPAGPQGPAGPGGPAGPAGAGFSSGVRHGDEKYWDGTAWQNNHAHAVFADRYGATGLIGSNDNAAIQAALADALANPGGDVNFPQFAEFVPPSGVSIITQPLRVKRSKFRIRGPQRESALLRPTFYGSCIEVGPDVSEAVTANTGPFTGTGSFQCNHTNQYFWDLGLWNGKYFNGFGACTWQFWLKQTSTTVGAPTNVGSVVYSSQGDLYPGDPTNAQNATSIQIQVLDPVAAGLGPNHIDAVWVTITIGGVVHTILSSTTANWYPALNTWTHLAVDYDSTDGKIRLLINGNVVQTVTASGTVTQQKWETSVLGPNMNTFPRGAPRWAGFPGLIGPVAIDGSVSGRSVYNGVTTTYTVPAAKFVVNATTCVAMQNWDNPVDDFWVGNGYAAWSAYWIPSRLALGDVLTEVEIVDIGMVGGTTNGAAGLVHMQRTTCAWVSGVSAQSCGHGVFAENNCFKSHFDRIKTLGTTNSDYGVVDVSAGNENSHGRHDLNHHGVAPLMLRGGSANCSNVDFVGWGLAAVVAYDGVYALTACQWDAEDQAVGSQAAMLVGGSLAQVTVDKCNIDPGSVDSVPVIVADFAQTGPYSLAVRDSTATVWTGKTPEVVHVHSLGSNPVVADVTLNDYTVCPLSLSPRVVDAQRAVTGHSFSRASSTSSEIYEATTSTATTGQTVASFVLPRVTADDTVRVVASVKCKIPSVGARSALVDQLFYWNGSAWVEEAAAGGVQGSLRPTTTTINPRFSITNSATGAVSVLVDPESATAGTKWSTTVQMERMQ